MANLSAPPDPPLFKYDAIRGLIQDGDIFLFRGTIFVSRVIETISAGAYSHCAIAAAWGERKMLLQAEMMGGVQAVPLSVAIGTYRGRVDWYTIGADWRAKLDIAALLAEARADLGLTYATSELLRVAAHTLFGTALPPDCDNPHALFCSQYVARCFRKAGLGLTDDTDIGTSPSEIAASKVLRFQGVILHDPNNVPDRHADAIVEGLRAG